MKAGDSIKFLAGLAFASLFRLVPMPLPNLEPIMATALPFAKRMGPLAGMLFAFAALVSWDFISGRLGLWTLYTGIAYAAVGYCAGKFFAERKMGLRNRVGFAVAATVFYDAVTALAFGWQFGQPLAVTLMGQIPFTAYHLLGNAAAVAVLTPVIDAAIVENKALDVMADGSATL
jgi:hypothetical protein